MQNLQDIISEKLRIGKSIKVYDLPKDVTDKPLYISNHKIEFPLTLEIDHTYTENIIGYKSQANVGVDRYNFYNDENKIICSMNYQELEKIFVDEKGMMLNTYYGWKGTIWRH